MQTNLVEFSTVVDYVAIWRNKAFIFSTRSVACYTVKL